MRRALTSILSFFLIFSTPAYALDVTYGTAVEVAADTVSRANMQAIGTDKLVICYADSQAGICRAATVSGTVPTLGTAAQFESDMIAGTEPSFLALANLDTDRFIAIYLEDADNDPSATAGSVSTTTITYGSEVELENADWEQFMGAGKIATDKWVVTFDSEGNSDTCESMVGTVDGSLVITTGATNECDGDGTTDFFPKRIDTIGIDTDTWVSCFLAEDDAGNDSYCVVGTASGTTITYSVDPSEHSTVNYFNNDLCSPFAYGGTANRAVLVGGLGGGSLFGTAMTNSSDTITYGTAFEFTGSLRWAGCTFVTETQFVVMYENEADTAGTSKLCEVNWSTRVITCGSGENFVEDSIGESVNNHPGSPITTLSGFDGDTPKIAIGYIEDADGDDLMLIVGDLDFAVVSAAPTDVKGVVAKGVVIN